MIFFPKNSKTGLREDLYDLYPKRFYNYATLGMIPPGSTFKPVTSVAALEDKVITPSSTVYANGQNFGQHIQRYLVKILQTGQEIRTIQDMQIYILH